MTDQKLRLGIDFGGTKTEIIGLDAQNGKELYRKRIPTRRDDYDQTLRSFVSLVEEAEASLDMKGTVGMGIPGTVSTDTNLIKNSNSVWMNGKPLQKDLGALLGRDVRIQNDANCFAVSEARDGAGKGAKIVFGVIIGTGCGGGIAIEGKPVSGVNGIGGEWGHNPLPSLKFSGKGSAAWLAYFDHELGGNMETAEIYKHKDPIEYITDDPSWNEYPGPACYCGKRGCLERWISGTGFKNDYARVTGEVLSTHDIVAKAETGEEKCVAALDRYIDRLARALAQIINILDPDVIVLGGGMSNVERLYEDVPRVWDRYVFSDSCKTSLRPPRHGDSSGVRGAAWLW